MGKISVTDADSLFQFPSNGKGFPNDNGVAVYLYTNEFQFPSNGKGFPNSDSTTTRTQTDTSFNSLQTGKAFRTIVSVVMSMSTGCSFNSLQTGKAFRTGMVIGCRFGGWQRFNSLQTGKAFRTYGAFFVIRYYRVSIPFKRERLSEHFLGVLRRLGKYEFQFPSNGKGFPNDGRNERLSTREVCFNSLQTGKAFRTKENWEELLYRN